MSELRKMEIAGLLERMIRWFPMPEKLRTKLIGCVDLILYLIVGVLTTLLNGLVYWISMKCGIPNVPSTVIAWIIAVLFAFWANKWIVFSSRNLDFRFVLREMMQFFGFRLGTGVLDVAIMYVTVDQLHWHPLLMKLISDFIVTVINFVASKFYIFAKRKRKESAD